MRGGLRKGHLSAGSGNNHPLHGPLHPADSNYFQRAPQAVSLRLVPDPTLPRLIDYEVRMLDKVTAITAWALLAFIAFATLSPIEDRPTLASSSSIEHVAALPLSAFCSV
jgi:hypothetical protein